MSNTRSANVKEYTRIFIDDKVSPDGWISDSTIAFTERILCCGNDVKYDATFLNEVGLDGSKWIYDFPFKDVALDELFDANDFEKQTQRMAHMMLLLLKRIPVILKKTDMPEELLGAYFHGNNDYKPWIELYSYNILTYANKYDDKDSFKYLAAEVLIHELAHALMDPYNYCKTDSYSDEYKKYKHPFCGADSILIALSENQEPGEIEKLYRGRMDFYTAREESFANVITYRIISHIGNRSIRKGLVSYVKRFIEEQPVQYAFAMSVYSFSSGIREWIEAKTNTLISDQDAYDWMDAASIYWDNETYNITQYEEDMRTKFRLNHSQIPWHYYPWIK